jgi:hypothetical protein
MIVSIATSLTGINIIKGTRGYRAYKSPFPRPKKVGVSVCNIVISQYIFWYNIIYKGM